MTMRLKRAMPVIDGLCPAVSVLLFVLVGCGGEEARPPRYGPWHGRTFEPPRPGIEELTHIAALPLLRYGSVTKQVSSRDKDGGNDDGFYGYSQLYIDQEGRYVVFDDYGPGCIYRMWFTCIASWLGELSIYVDDMTTPLVRCPFDSLFSSRVWPFTYPLVSFINESSGGYVSYIPICYSQRAKITLSVPPEFYSITYRRYTTDYEVRSFTGAEEYDLLLEQWGSVGEDPKPRVATRTKTVQVAISPESRELIWLDEGSGVVWNMSIDVAPLTLRTTSGLWIAAIWDGHDEYDVYAPFNEFFCSQDPYHPAKGLLLGRNDSYGYYCRFPMPYWSSAAILIENRGQEEVRVKATVEIADVRYPETSGYFTAHYHHEDPTTKGVDYCFASLQGAGHFMGVSYTMKGPITGSYMEGDERFYIDDSLTPSVYGTGTEDYFNGGWYLWLGRFSLPLHGSAYSLIWTPHKRCTTACYRIHLGDLIPFFRKAQLGIEHDAENSDTNDSHVSVAYAYRHPESLLVPTDELDIGEHRSMLDHEYTATGLDPPTVLTACFEGQQSDVPIRDHGHIVRTSSEFVVTVAKENVGALIRRRLDQSWGRQKGLVYVDDRLAGVWYDVYENPLLRWAESDFLVPASLSRGKDRLRIKIINDGQVPWSEFYYTIYSYLLPTSS